MPEAEGSLKDTSMVSWLPNSVEVAMLNPVKFQWFISCNPPPIAWCVAASRCSKKPAIFLVIQVLRFGCKVPLLCLMLSDALAH